MVKHLYKYDCNNNESRFVCEVSSFSAAASIVRQRIGSKTKFKYYSQGSGLVNGSWYNHDDVLEYFCNEVVYD